jgi:hypothetical protein
MLRFLKIITVLFIIILTGNKISAQGSAVAGFSTGFSSTVYNMDGYKNTSYFPFGAQITFGTYGIQLGPDWWTTLSGPQFTFNDTASGKELYSEKYHDTYFGGVIRAHAGDDPHDFTVIFSAGMGVVFSKETLDYSDYYLSLNPAPPLAEGEFKLKNSIAYKGTFGFSIPIGSIKIHKVGTNYGNLHLAIEGVYNYNPRDNGIVTEYRSSWGVHVGLRYVIFRFKE